MNSNPYRAFPLSFINMTAGEAFGLLEYGHIVTASNRVVQCVIHARTKRSVVGKYSQIVLGEYSLALVADLESLNRRISQDPTQHLTLTEVLQALNTCYGTDPITPPLIVPFCLDDQVSALEFVQMRNTFYFHLVDDGIDKGQDVIRFATFPGRFRLFCV